MARAVLAGLLERLETVEFSLLGRRVMLDTGAALTGTAASAFHPPPQCYPIDMETGNRILDPVLI